MLIYLVQKMKKKKYDTTVWSYDSFDLLEDLEQCMKWFLSSFSNMLVVYLFLYFFLSCWYC